VLEEIFGPVLTVQTFADEGGGLALAAHERYGLAAGVHTADIGRALRAMRGISAGTVWINRYGRSDDFVIPTGGYHQSGIGKDLGRQSVEANLRFKSVLIDFRGAALRCTAVPAPGARHAMPCEAPPNHSFVAASGRIEQSIGPAHAAMNAVMTFQGSLTMTFRPKYISFDCYGTLTRFRMGDMARDMYADRIPADRMEQFVADFSAYRFDEVLGDWQPYEVVLKNALRRTCRKWKIQYLDHEAQKYYDAVPPGARTTTSPAGSRRSRTRSRW
jgi:hypothetical protein